MGWNVKCPHCILWKWLLWAVVIKSQEELFLLAPMLCHSCLSRSPPPSQGWSMPFGLLKVKCKTKERIGKERGIFDNAFDVNNIAFDTDFVSHRFRQYPGSSFMSKSSSTINSGFLSHCKVFWHQNILNCNSKMFTKAVYLSVVLLYLTTHMWYMVSVWVNAPLFHKQQSWASNTLGNAIGFVFCHLISCSWDYCQKILKAKWCPVNHKLGTTTLRSRDVFCCIFFPNPSYVVDGNIDISLIRWK